MGNEAEDKFGSTDPSLPVPSPAAIDIGVTRNFDKPDEIRTFPKGRLELLELGGSMVGRCVFEPGWRWETHVRPLVNTSSCLAPHLQYHVKGVMHVVMDDGTEFDCHPGDVSWLPEGHDAWTVGDEAVEVIDFHGMLEYAETRKKQAERNLERLIAESPLPMLVHDTELSIKSVLLNKRFIETICCNADEITTLQSWFEEIIPDNEQREQLAKSWEQTAVLSAEKNEQVTPLMVPCLCTAGQPCIFEVHLTRTGSQTIAVFVDATKQQEIQKNLSHAASHDALTGLLNRRGYDDEIKRVWEEARFSRNPVSAIMIDIDYFKQYNDHYGHADGDVCLQRVATALLAHSNDKRCVVARLGGEEFGIIIPDCSLSEASAIAEHARIAIEELSLPHINSQVSSVVTLSLGVASTLPASNDIDAAELLKRADQLMYRSKENGRNQVTSEAKH